MTPVVTGHTTNTVFYKGPKMMCNTVLVTICLGINQSACAPRVCELHRRFAKGQAGGVTKQNMGVGTKPGDAAVFYLDFFEEKEQVFHLVVFRGAVLQGLVHGPTGELPSGQRTKTNDKRREGGRERERK